MALTIKTNKCCYFCDNNLLVGAAIPLLASSRLSVSGDDQKRGAGRAGSSTIKGFCEQLMDECFLMPLFQNESSCETFHVKSVRRSHMNGFALRLVLT